VDKLVHRDNLVNTRADNPAFIAKLVCYFTVVGSLKIHVLSHPFPFSFTERQRYMKVNPVTPKRIDL